MARSAFAVCKSNIGPCLVKKACPAWRLSLNIRIITPRLIFPLFHHPEPVPNNMSYFALLKMCILVIGYKFKSTVTK